MENEFGENFVTITDEDGVEYELEILSTVEFRGALYYALAPIDTDEDEDVQVSILRAEEENGEEILCAVEDDDELEAVYALLIDQMYEDEEEES